jgi:hypothetical protein
MTANWRKREAKGVNASDPGVSAGGGGYSGRAFEGTSGQYFALPRCPWRFVSEVLVVSSVSLFITADPFCGRFGRCESFRNCRQGRETRDDGLIFAVLSGSRTRHSQGLSDVRVF